MTDEEVRARLAWLSRGDPISLSLHSLNALQFGLILVVASPPSGIFFGLGIVALASIPLGWILRRIRLRSESRLPPEAARNRYGAQLERTIRYIRNWSVLWVFFLIMSAALSGMLLLLLLRNPDRDPMSVPVGLPIAIGCLLWAIDLRRAGRTVLPRLEREKAEFQGQTPCLSG